MAVKHAKTVTFPTEASIDVSFGNEASIKSNFSEGKFAKTSLDDFPEELRIGLGAMRVGTTFKIGIYYD